MAPAAASVHEAGPPAATVCAGYVSRLDREGIGSGSVPRISALAATGNMPISVTV